MHSRGITSLPVTIIDDDEVIIGYYPKKLIPALGLEVQVDLSGKTSWLAAKYDMMLEATRRAIQQLSDEQLQQHNRGNDHQRYDGRPEGDPEQITCLAGADWPVTHLLGCSSQ